MVTATTRPTRPLSTCIAPAQRSRPSPTCARAPSTGPARRRAPRWGHRDCRRTVLGTAGRLRVSAIRVQKLDAAGQPAGPVRRIRCDLVLMSGGFTPSVHLFSQSRGKLAWDESLRRFMPGQAAERVRSAGACRGVFSTRGRGPGRHARRALRRAGRRALGRGLLAGRFARSRERCRRAFSARSPSRPSDASKAFVDWQNDVTTRDLALAAREGFRSIEHVKRYTTTGMATDQGKTSNLNALAIVARRAREGDPAGRPHHLPHALHARHASAASPASRAAICSIRCGPRRRTPGRARKARCSRTSACGSAHATSRARARTCTPRSRANASRCAAPAASSTPRRSARSRSWARMPRSS